jgi:hypothetical protein
MPRILTGYIDEDDCIGDSLGPQGGGSKGFINTNSLKLDEAIQSLSATDVVLNNQIQNLTGQIKPSIFGNTVFQPVRFNTKTNNNAVIISHSWDGPGNGSELPDTNTNSLQQTGNNQRAWWSGIKTVTLTNVPIDTVALLVEIFYNVNSFANNSQRLFVRKNNTENTGWPTLGSGDITQAVRDTFDNNYRKIILDPTGSSSVPFEAEHSVTIVVYPTGSGTTRTFEYCIVDDKQVTPTTTPYYFVGMNLQGYFIEVK